MTNVFRLFSVAILGLVAVGGAAAQPIPGVELRVCGQAVLAKNIEPKTIVPEIHLDLWALTTFTTLELQGYVRVGGAG